MHYFVAVTKRQVNKPVYAKHKLRKNISFVKNSLTATSTKKTKKAKENLQRCRILHTKHTKSIRETFTVSYSNTYF